MKINFRKYLLQIIIKYVSFKEIHCLCKYKHTGIHVPNMSTCTYIIQGPKVLCVICEKEGHLKMNCPEDTLPELHPLPAMTKEHLMILTDVLNNVPSKILFCVPIELTGVSINSNEQVILHIRIFTHQDFYANSTLK